MASSIVVLSPLSNLPLGNNLRGRFCTEKVFLHTVLRLELLGLELSLAPLRL